MRQRVPAVSSIPGVGMGALDAADAVGFVAELRHAERAADISAAVGRLTATAVSVRGAAAGDWVGSARSRGWDGSTCRTRLLAVSTVRTPAANAPTRRSLASQSLNVVALMPCAAQYAACV